MAKLQARARRSTRPRTMMARMPDTSRRGFLISAPLLVATLVRCSNTIWDQTRFADAFITDPDASAYRPALDAVIAAILPLERSDFPVHSVDVIGHRFLSMFPLESNDRFAALQRTLTLFDQIELFTIFSGPLLQREAIARDAPHRGEDMNALASTIQETDANALDAFRRELSAQPGARFTSLPLEARRRYLALWQNSASVVKREFHSALRALVMITAYSMDEVWPSIGYAGPLVQKAHS